MIQQEDEKFQKKRIRGAHFTTILSIAMVLFLLGVQGLILGYTHKISNYVKENIGFTLMIKEFTREQDILDLKAKLDSSSYVKSTRYITKEEAAQELQKDLGHDFIDFLGYNPLLPSIEIHLNAQYTHNDSIARFEKILTRYHLVKEMYYQKDLVSLVNDHVKQISFWLSSISLLILIVSITLINNTLRLLIYSKRFTINSMQLVGATASFIRRPFLLKSLLQSLIGSLIAILFLSLALFYLDTKFPDIIGTQDFSMILCVYGLLFTIGLLFTFLSAWFSVNKYLHMRNSDNIYR
ncbi:MAG: permease-like cell division protein FtsX [Bacteroidales bacterium]